MGVAATLPELSEWTLRFSVQIHFHDLPDRQRPIYVFLGHKFERWISNWIDLWRRNYITRVQEGFSRKTATLMINVFNFAFQKLPLPSAFWHLCRFAYTSRSCL